MGERKPAGARSRCLQEGVQGREGEVRHVHGAEQQALLGVVLHQPVQGQQGPFPGRWLGQGGERAGARLGLLPARPQLLPQPLGHHQVLRVAAQQRDRAVQVGQQPQGALQPGAALGVGQQGLVAPHAPAFAAAEQAAAQRRLWHCGGGDGRNGRKGLSGLVRLVRLGGM